MNNLQVYVQHIKKIYLNYRNNFEGKYTKLFSLPIRLEVFIKKNEKKVQIA